VIKLHPAWRIQKRKAAQPKHSAQPERTNSSKFVSITEQKEGVNNANVLTRERSVFLA
jgi:hypothetical protein